LTFGSVRLQGRINDPLLNLIEVDVEGWLLLGVHGAVKANLKRKDGERSREGAEFAVLTKNERG